jgi:hypothetical protein
MKTPQMNAAGYDETSVKRMEGFHRGKYFLAHGLADDNGIKSSHYLHF